MVLRLHIKVTKVYTARFTGIYWPACENLEIFVPCKHRSVLSLHLGTYTMLVMRIQFLLASFFGSLIGSAA